MQDQPVVLVLNAGSSSLKFCVYSATGQEEWQALARGQVEGIGSHPRFSATEAGGRTVDWPLGPEVSDAQAALQALGVWLRETFASARVIGVGHRVVHGGPRHAAPAVVTAKLLEELRTLIPLAPLHQPYNLAAIDAVAERLPGVPQVACFDTAFHRGHHAVADLVPLPSKIRRTGVRRYGFHGLSYEYVASVRPQVAPESANRRVGVAHLGSGASLCAMERGKSVDSSFGFTALDGLCMGTRPGAIDPGVVLYLFQALDLSPKDVEAVLYKKSGLLGVSGISNDMRVLLGSNESGARLAVDYFVYQAAKQIGALAAVMGGIDALVFTAGIGENSAEVRERICKACAWLGVELDAEANARNAPRITTAGSKASAWVVRTNEELMIARHTGLLLGLVDRRACATGAA